MPVRTPSQPPPVHLAVDLAASQDEFQSQRRNGRYCNPGAPPQEFRKFLQWIAHRDLGPWRPFNESGVDPRPGPPVRIQGEALRLSFINHATTLIQTAGCNLLTDPIWSERASPVSWAGPRRRRSPGIPFEQLPPVDAVLISHSHYDHLDTATLRRLLRRGASAGGVRGGPAVFCPAGLGRLLSRLGFREVYELDWGQHLDWRNLTLHCVPAQHFSARTPFDRNRTLWCGWVAECPSGAIYFAGDTGFGGHFAAIARRFPRLRLALLPIGAYRPEWFMGPIHMTPEQALEAQAILGARRAVAIHWGTFPLADDGEQEPVERLRRALASQPPERLAYPFHILENGESLELAGKD